jgi:competence protein ComEC
MDWQWDGVDFTILHPAAAAARRGNNASCVLQVGTGGHRALLSGDIERPVELMLAHRGLLQPSQLVVVPHHGSRTSSTSAFVASVHADFAVVSAGYGNRWGFPRPDVVRRWEQSGASVLTTADSGAISQRICHASPEIPRKQRNRYRRYWHAATPGTD